MCPSRIWRKGSCLRETRPPNVRLIHRHREAPTQRARSAPPGELFRGRLADEVLDDALEYLDHGEEGAAIGVLCDQLMEFEVGLSAEEWELLRDLSRRLRSSGGTPMEKLRTLIRSEDPSAEPPKTT